MQGAGRAPGTARRGIGRGTGAADQASERQRQCWVPIPLCLAVCHFLLLSSGIAKARHRLRGITGVISIQLRTLTTLIQVKTATPSTKVTRGFFVAAPASAFRMSGMQLVRWRE